MDDIDRITAEHGPNRTPSPVEAGTLRHGRQSTAERLHVCVGAPSIDAVCAGHAGGIEGPQRIIHHSAANDIVGVGVAAYWVSRLVGVPAVEGG